MLDVEDLHVLLIVVTLSRWTLKKEGGGIFGIELKNKWMNEWGPRSWCLSLILLCVVFVERVMPYFSQEPLSYLKLPTIKNSYKAFKIKITFRPDNVDGKHLSSENFFFSRSLCGLKCNQMLHVVFVNSSCLLFCPDSYRWFEGLILYSGESSCLNVSTWIHAAGGRSLSLSWAL